MGIPLDKAEILALFLETFLYGIFFTLFWITLLVLIQRGKTAKIQRHVLIPVASLMLVLATCHIIIDFVRVVQAFIVLINVTPGGASGYYANIAHPLHVGKTALYVTQTLLGDGVIIWRCYVVYNKSLYVLIPPTIVQIVNGCAGYVVVWSLSQATPGSNIFHTASSWITTFFVLTMCINVSCTAAISWRIYSTGRLTNASRSLLPVMIIIVESGALYTSGVLGLLIAFLTGSNGQYPALDVVTPLVGIAFSLIVLQIRFHLGSSSTPGHSSAGTTRAPSAVRHWGQRAPQHGRDTSLGYVMQPMAIQITEQTDVHYPDKTRLSPHDDRSDSIVDKPQEI